MGSNAEKIRIIEFNGLPGTGKTTIAKILGEKIEKSFHCPVLYSYYRHKYQERRLSYLFSPEYYHNFMKLREFSRSFSEPSHINYLLYEIGFLRMYHQYLQDYTNGMLIIDQGILQGLLSISYKEIINNIDLIKDILHQFNFGEFPISIINCKSDVDTSITRLAKRNGNISRVQELAMDESMRVLNIQSQNLFTLRSIVSSEFSGIPIINLNTVSESPSSNANQIFDLLFQ